MSKLSELPEKSIRRLRIRALLHRRYLYALFLFVAMALFVASLPFKGVPRFLHVPHAAEFKGEVSWQPAPDLVYTLENNPPAPDYVEFHSKWHPQKDVTRVSLFFRERACPRELYDDRGNPVAELKSCGALGVEALSRLPTQDGGGGLYQADYALSAALEAGVTRIRMKTTDPTPVQITQSVNKVNHLLALQIEQLKFGDVYRQLWGRGKFNTFFFVLALALLAFGWVLVSQSSRASLLLALFSISFALLGLVPKFSGNDETAHFSMLLESAKERSTDSEGGAAKIVRVNAAARTLMFVEDFFKLHRVYPPREGDCLHQIIGSCGITEKPKNFYKKYLAWLSLDSIEAIGVGKVLALIRLQNLVVFFISIFLLAWLFKLKLEYLAPVFILFSSPYSTIISLSNDIFGVLLGVFLVACQFWLMQSKTTFKFRFLATLLGFFLIYLGTRIDSNAYAAMPVLFANCLFLGVSLVETRGYNSNKIMKIIGLIFLPVFSVALFILIRNFFAHYGASTVQSYLGFLEDGSVIKFLGMVPIETSLEFLLTFLRGALGQFVWSHTSYPNYLSYFLLVCFSLFVLYSIARSFLHTNNLNSEFKFDLKVLICLLVQALLLALLVDSVGGYGSTNSAGAWSFLVSRFYYPGVAVLFVPFLLAIDSYPLEKRTLVLRVTRYASLSWVTINLIYFYPRFFLADAW